MASHSSIKSYSIQCIRRDVNGYKRSVTVFMMNCIEDDTYYVYASGTKYADGRQYTHSGNRSKHVNFLYEAEDLFQELAHDPDKTYDQVMRDASDAWDSTDRYN